jgi:tetratricopeptide (TPR) repeat protein
VLRFEAERQALAMMDHPGIAKVLDGGATNNGRPFFVMELVDGVPITEYCDKEKLKLGERLELFAQVCEAIQHAHQKGIIHRDIKPSNVLVAVQDGVASPKVIDFGIAKATGAELAQQTMFTQVGQMIGTPEYMAPEQAGSGGLDVDTRADVYSLGVLLYELLTGTKTFDLQSVLESGYEELLRTIREVDPVRPSTRISGLGESATAIAATRRDEPTTLFRKLRGELDWIVMKALDKDRERRYESSNELALDIRRYQENQPVLAVPPSALYRWRKLVRRRKKTVVAVLLIALLFVAGSIGTGVGYWRTLQANRALDVALGEKDAALASEVMQRELANENAQRAQAAEAEARSETKRAVDAEALAHSETQRAVEAEARTQARAVELELVSKFQAAQLSDIDPALMGTLLRDALIDSAGAAERDELAANLASINFTNIALGSLQANLFDRTIEAIDAQFVDQPVVRSGLLQTMSDTLYDLGLYERAVEPQERALAIRRAALGDDDPLTIVSIGRNGALLVSRGKLDEAEPFLLEAVETSRRIRGDKDPNTLIWLTELAALHQDRGEVSEAEAMLREVVEGLRQSLGAEHEQTLATISNLGVLLKDRGSFAEAELLIGEVLEAHRKLFGPDHPSTLHSINSMGVLLYAQGRLVEAEAYMREAVESRRRVLGDNHPDTINALGNLGVLLRTQGRVSEAEPYHHAAFEGNHRLLGEEHRNTLMAMRNLGGLLEEQGKLSEAEALYLKALETCRRVLGDEHRDTLLIIGSLGTLRYADGRVEEAELLFREGLEGWRRVLGEDHPDMLTESYNLGVLLRNLGKLSEAESLLVTAFEGRMRVLGAAHSRTADANNSLFTLFELRVSSARESGDEQLLGTALTKLGTHEFRSGNFANAERLLGEALDLVFRTLPETDARVRQVLGTLGAAIAGQGRYAEAEPLIRESAERTLASEDVAVDPAQNLVQRTIDFYEAWHEAEPGAGHQATADQWRSWQASRREQRSSEPSD